jgi:hypothetical protein
MYREDKETRDRKKFEEANEKEKEEENKRLEMALSRNDEVRIDETWEGSAGYKESIERDEYTNRSYENASREYAENRKEEYDCNEEDRGREEKSEVKHEAEDC